VPLSQLAQARFVWEPGVVWRYGRQWAITVQSDVADGIQGPTVSMQIEPKLTALHDYPQFGDIDLIVLAGFVRGLVQGEKAELAGLQYSLFHRRANLCTHVCNVCFFIVASPLTRHSRGGWREPSGFFGASNDTGFPPNPAGMTERKINAREKYCKNMCID